jgi:hypothetical protein
VFYVSNFFLLLHGSNICFLTSKKVKEMYYFRKIKRQYLLHNIASSIEKFISFLNCLVKFIKIGSYKIYKCQKPFHLTVTAHL